MSTHRRTPVKARPSPQYQPRKVPAWDIITSYVGLGPIRHGRIAVTRALVREQRTIGKYRVPDKASYLEGQVLSQGKAAAERIRDQAAARLATMANEVEGLRAQVASCEMDMQRLDEYPVVGITGDLQTAQAAARRMDQLIQLVGTETADGSLKHRRVVTWLQRVAPLVPVIDLPVLFWFVGSVFNVNFSNLDATQLIPLLTSGVFAILGTAAVAMGLRYFGSDLKGYKDGRGHIVLPAGRAATLPLLFLAFSITTAIGTGVVMAYRIISDSLSAGTGWFAAATLGLFFSVVIAMLNTVVWAAHYRDGSTATDELDHLTTALRPINLKRLQLQKRRDDLKAKAAQQIQQAATFCETTKGSLDQYVNGVFQVVAQARAYHQGAGWNMELLTPEGKCHGLMAPLITIDTSLLDRLMQRIRGEQDIVPESYDENSARE